jgi:hypothetical protein
MTTQPTTSTASERSARTIKKVRTRAPSPDESRPQTAPGQQPLQWVTARIEPQLIRDIEAYAKKGGMTRSDAIRECLAAGMEAITERGGIPGSRAEELLQAIDGVRTAADILGPPAFGMLRLLAHWAVQTGSLKVSEDELLAEVRLVGADEWEQAVTDAEREMQERQASKPGGRR